MPLAGILVLLLVGCSIGKTMHTSSLFAMNTIMELEVAGDEQLLRDAEEMIRSLEKELSVTDENSEIARLNQTGEAKLGGQVADILERTLDLCEETGGALDISIYPVLRAWGFTTGSYRVPDDSEIRELLTKVDYSRIEMGDLGDGEEVAASGDAAEDIGEEVGKDAAVDSSDAVNKDAAVDSSGIVIKDAEDQYEFAKEHNQEGCVTKLQEGMQIDLGSVVKGYTATAVANYFKKEGVTSALINLGGNVQCVGTKPNGEKWKVAVKSPFSDSSTGILGVIEASDVAIITSGGYERFFEDNGEIYWHILDPKTGRPARSGLASVTVIGTDGLYCDGLSTALFVMGPDRAIEFWKANGDFDAVMVTEDGKVYVTEGISASFSLAPEYRNAELVVVKRD
jgi:thiamine biosynthesis lipoprotein